VGDLCWANVGVHIPAPWICSQGYLLHNYWIYAHNHFVRFLLGRKKCLRYIKMIILQQRKLTDTQLFMKVYQRYFPVKMLHVSYVSEHQVTPQHATGFVPMPSPQAHTCKYMYSCDSHRNKKHLADSAGGEESNHIRDATRAKILYIK
jgi:hypothetical protein